ncbi:ImmA/IrrE family metallo-endopeptidase [Enterocloster bolteae]|mgnify:FL=1|uniref:ImmA/IrrE family metallo-endopeptidase n=1 Tax=Enterocloster bolteae TaxID=208479 RepID=UPI002A83DDCA|nr:ImmA/IrrE family metallo-endopeptidase [Enterocloster bolteae]
MTRNEHLKALAYSFYMREAICGLPLDPIAILGRRDYTVKPYYEIPPPGESPKIIVRTLGNAFVTPRSEFKYRTHYIIGINTYCSKEEQRWALMHELSHIELGHVIDLIGNNGFGASKGVLEAEARDLSLFLACPDIILEHLDALTANKIYSICKIPYEIALKKSEYFRSLEYRLSALRPESVMEKRLVYTFQDYITEYYKKKVIKWEMSDELCF